MNRTKALTLDMVCWISLTAGLVYFDYPTIAGLVGAYTVVYLLWGVRKIKQMKEVERMFAEALAEYDEAYDEHDSLFDDEDDIDRRGM